jgi:hypothetical protein
MSEYDPVQAAAGEAYYDRSTGLMVFGVMTIALGALAALLAVVTVLSLAMATLVPNAQVTPAAVLPGICIYVGAAVVLIWLGIGSIKARRWARALLLIMSWSWLIVGVFDIGIMAFILPKVLSNLPMPQGPDHTPIPVQPGVVTTIVIVTMLFMGIFMVVLPGVWLFFYSSRHVKLTCEWRDPVVRWTDLCPLPVLGLCLWLAFTAFTMLVMNAMPYLAAPFFGMLVSGIAARAVYAVMGLIWFGAAWLMYRLDSRGWWLALAGCLAFTISAMLTYSQHDIMEMYRLMHYPEEQLAQIEKTGLLKGNMMMWFTPLFMLPLIGYMAFIKKYLR